ncbi:MAG TPA: hypothetical protein VGA96_09470 [Fibrella sp.]|jgi:hypothetical protein
MPKIIREKQVQQLISALSTTVRDDLKTDTLNGFIYFQVESAKILQLLATNQLQGVLFDSEAELLEVREASKKYFERKRGSSRPVFDPPFALSTYLNKELAERLKQLADVFGFDQAKFDPSLDTARAIDKKIKAGDLTVNTLSEDLFPYLALFVGEALIQLNGDRWATHFNKPLIEKSGKTMDFSVELYEDLTERPKRFNLVKFIKGMPPEVDTL